MKSKPRPDPPPREPSPDVAEHVQVGRCPYCHDRLAAESETWRACAQCLARHHAACWEEGSRCSACGHEAYLQRSGGGGRRRRWPLVASAGLALLLGAGVVLWRTPEPIEPASYPSPATRQAERRDDAGSPTPVFATEQALVSFLQSQHAFRRDAERRLQGLRNEVVEYVGAGDSIRPADGVLRFEELEAEVEELLDQHERDVGAVGDAGERFFREGEPSGPEARSRLERVAELQHEISSHLNRAREVVSRLHREGREARAEHELALQLRDRLDALGERDVPPDDEALAEVERLLSEHGRHVYRLENEEADRVRQAAERALAELEAAADAR